MPVDPPDTEFDRISVNGEGSYYKAVVGGVRNVVDYVTAEANVPENASGSHLQTPPQYKYSTLRLFSPFILILTRSHTSVCKSS